MGGRSELPRFARFFRVYANFYGHFAVCKKRTLLRALSATVWWLNQSDYQIKCHRFTRLKENEIYFLKGAVNFPNSRCFLHFMQIFIRNFAVWKKELCWGQCQLQFGGLINRIFTFDRTVWPDWKMKWTVKSGLEGCIHRGTRQRFISIKAMKKNSIVNNRLVTCANQMSSWRTIRVIRGHRGNAAHLHIPGTHSHLICIRFKHDAYFFLPKKLTYQRYNY